MAGNLALGPGRLIGGFDGDSDGTVGLAETRAPDQDERCLLPVSHFGMLVSRRVAEAVASYLRTGHFPDGCRS